MLKKIKTIELDAERLAEAAGKLGMAMMATAAAIGLLEFTDRRNERFVTPARATVAVSSVSDGNNNPLRREREESGPHYISYSVNQRTPGRSKHYA